MAGWLVLHSALRKMEIFMVCGSNIFLNDEENAAGQEESISHFAATQSNYIVGPR